MLRFGFDLLDPTKLVPEEVVPYTPLGMMELNANPTNYFAEVEQAGVCIPIYDDQTQSNFRSSNPVTSFLALTSPMTPCCKAVCSPTWTPS